MQDNTSTTADNARGALLDKLRRLVNSRPGFDWHNYDTATSLRADMRAAARQRRAALAMLDYVTDRPASYPLDALVADLRRGGRLELTDSGTIRYIAGQYYPTEYRGAVARYLANLIWWQECAHERARGASDRPGDAVRKLARERFGRGIANVYFN